MEQALEEFSHYRLFAAIYQAAGDGSAPARGADPDEHDWPENKALRVIRQHHQADVGALGQLAYRVTEGGGSALVAEGARLKGEADLDR